MAKRTYRDQNGYKRKKRKRGTPEFATIEEYHAYLARKREAARSKHPNYVLRGKAIPEPKDPLVDLAKKLEEGLRDVQGPEEGASSAP